MSDDLTFNLVVSRLRNDFSCDQIGLGPIWTTANDFFSKHGSNPWQKTSSSALALLISIKPRDCESAHSQFPTKSLKGALDFVSVEETWCSEAASHKLGYGVYTKSTRGAAANLSTSYGHPRTSRQY
jgi:hypothetical protein